MLSSAACRDSTPRPGARRRRALSAPLLGAALARFCNFADNTVIALPAKIRP